jgi:hypothetical protein
MKILQLKTCLYSSWLLIFLTSSQVWAAGVDIDPVGSGSIRIDNPLKDNIDSIPELVSIILSAVVQVGVPVVALGIIYSGFLFVQAQGKPEEISRAKAAFAWTLAGAAIVLGAFVIVEIIQGTIDQLK